MGNAVVCQSTKSKNHPSRRRQNEKEPKQKQGIQQSTKQQEQIQEKPTTNTSSNEARKQKEQLQNNSKQQQQAKYDLSSQNQLGQYLCNQHQTETIKAVCVSTECRNRMEGQLTSRVLCCECLIEHTCPNKMRTLEFVAKLRACLSKEALDVFMEIFDDQSPSKQDTELVVYQIMEQIKSKLVDYAERLTPSLITSFYLSSTEIKTISSLDVESVRGLELIIRSKTQEASSVTIEFALMLIQNAKLTEVLCEQIEKNKQTLVPFANDFVLRFHSLLTKYIHCVQVSALYQFKILVSI